MSVCSVSLTRQKTQSKRQRNNNKCISQSFCFAETLANFFFKDQLLYGPILSPKTIWPAVATICVASSCFRSKKWRILKCTRIICFLTNASWDQSANTQCKIHRLIFSLLLDLLKNASNEFLQNIPPNESKNRM